jgi:cation-transporting ATPase E
MPYPILPRHLTIIDSLVIGIPGFFLALAPNARRFVPGFVYRVARFVLPTG